MSDSYALPTAAPNPASPPVRPVWMARIDPPQDVTAAMEMVRATCEAWRAVPVQGIQRYSAEAELCDRITGYTTPEKTEWFFGLAIGIGWTLAAVCAFIVVRDTYCGIRRMIAVRCIRPSTTPTTE